LQVKSGQVSKILQAAFAPIRSLAQTFGAKRLAAKKNGPTHPRRAAVNVVNLLKFSPI
jgi:hypothetical protein